MRYRPLGTTGLHVSEVGLGTWPLGGPTRWAQGYISYGPTDDEKSLGVIRRAIDLGVTFIDTADIYGDGRAEELIARAIGRRQDIIVGTKVGYDMYGGREGKIWTEEHLRYACEQSLRRLQRDTIDLYQLHTPPLDVIARGEVFDVLDRLRVEGKIKHYGLSILTAQDGVEAMRSGSPATFQVAYNLLRPEMEDELFPTVLDRGVGIIVREPLANGRLTGTMTADTTFPETDHRSRWPRDRFLDDLKRVESLRFLVDEQRPTLARAALAYVLSHPAVSTVIPGALTADEVEDNVAASGAAPLPDAALQRLHS